MPTTDGASYDVEVATMINEHDGSTKSSEARLNFNLLALNQIFLRIGWIFKTESVIVPAFMDSLGASSWQRGMLPAVARIGQSLPQFFVASWLSGKTTYRKYAFLSTLFQSLPWITLTILLFVPQLSRSIMLWLFLILYTFHWFVFGSYALLIGAMQGKLVPTLSRGRLLGISNFTGCMLSCVAAAMLMPGWVRAGNRGYALIFAATAIGFFVAAACLLPAVERPGKVEKKSESFGAQSLQLLRDNANVRRLIGVVTLSYASFLLFPHYEKFGSKVLGVPPGNRVNMVIIQNLMNAFASAFIGPLTDRRGNRLALSIAMGMIGLAPLFAVVMSWLPGNIGHDWYWLVFGIIGFNPVTGRVMVNYVLEVAPETEHPLYLGTINVVQAAPLLLSPFVGLAIDLTSFQAVFMVFAVVMFAGAALSMTLHEPRHRPNVMGIGVEEDIAIKEGNP